MFILLVPVKYDLRKLFNQTTLLYDCVTHNIHTRCITFVFIRDMLMQDIYATYNKYSEILQVHLVYIWLPY